MTFHRLYLFTFFLLFLTIVPTFAQQLALPPSSAAEAPLWDVTFSDSLHGFAVGDWGTMQRTTDGGKSWVAKFAGSQLAFRNVHFFSRDVGIAAGFWGTVYRTSNGGEDWKRLEMNIKNHLPAMAYAGDSTIWLAGEMGILLKSTDRGTTWRSLPSHTNKTIDAMSFVDEQSGWLSSVQGTLMHTTDGGETWVAQHIPSLLPVTTLFAESASVCRAAGYRGLLATTRDTGKTWQLAKAYDTNYQRLRVDRSGRAWMVGTRGAVVRIDPADGEGKLFQLLDVHSANSIVLPTDSTAVVVGDRGIIRTIRTKD